MQNRLCYYMINPQSSILVLNPLKLSLHILDNTVCDIILHLHILASTLDRVAHSLNRFIVRLAVEVVDELASELIRVDVIDDVLGFAALGEAIGDGIDGFRSVVVEHVGEGLVAEAHLGNLGREFVLVAILGVVRLVLVLGLVGGLILVLGLVGGLILVLGFVCGLVFVLRLVGGLVLVLVLLVAILVIIAVALLGLVLVVALLLIVILGLVGIVAGLVVVLRLVRGVVAGLV
ncbi:hypothetical protein K440DRAFT_53063 [Wilcoxina mikolae CBS 423.85]|nr:hypothetical protein K440DRAFT_53063 [Wilcoxina mikolae CBS 423.85]